MTAGDVPPAARASTPPDGPVPACTALIVTYQSERHVADLLSALVQERADGLDLDVVVVDNDSTDRTVEIVSGFGWVRLVRAGGNLGYAAGLNIAERHVADDRAVLVLNPDLVPAPGAVRRLLLSLGTSGAGAAVPRVEDPDGSLSPSLRYEPSVRRAFVDGLLGARAARLPRGWSVLLWDASAYGSVQFPDWAVGAVLAVSAACRAAVGPWDERYFLYCEETDYLRRVRSAGFRVRYEPSSVVRHVGGGSGISDGLYALLVVNSLTYYRRYHAALPALLFATALTLHQVVRLRRPQARLALRALLLPSWRSRLPHATVTGTPSAAGQVRDG